MRKVECPNGKTKLVRNYYFSPNKDFIMVEFEENDEDFYTNIPMEEWVNYIILE